MHMYSSRAKKKDDQRQTKALLVLLTVQCIVWPPTSDNQPGHSNELLVLIFILINVHTQKCGVGPKHCWIRARCDQVDAKRHIIQTTTWANSSKTSLCNNTLSLSNYASSKGEESFFGGVYLFLLYSASYHWSFKCGVNHFVAVHDLYMAHFAWK